MNKSIALAVKTGKVLFGTKNVLKNAKTGKVRLVITPTNCSQKLFKELKYHCELSQIPLTVYNGTAKDLGVLCGKPFAVSTLAIREPGDSDILEAVESG